MIPTDSCMNYCCHQEGHGPHLLRYTPVLQKNPICRWVCPIPQTGHCFILCGFITLHASEVAKQRVVSISVHVYVCMCVSEH